MGISMLNKLRLIVTLNKFINQIQKGLEMKSSTKIVTAVFAALTAVLMNPDVQGYVMQFVSHHPVVSIIVSGVTAVCATLHEPKES